MEIFAKLGIDWKLLIAQAINFGVLFWALRRFAYRPMLDFLEKRTERIEKGLKDAESAGVKLKEMEEKEKAVLVSARTEARAIIAVAEESAKKRDSEHLALTEAKAKKFLAEAEMKIEEEKRKVLASAKEEIVSLVTISVEKILREKMTPEKEKQVMNDRTP